MVITDDPIEPSTELELSRRARSGDADAFCRLIEPLQAALYRQAVMLLGDSSMAEDLVSETLVAAWSSFARFNGECRLSTWLYAILLHRHQKSIRRAWARPISLAWLPFFQADELDRRSMDQVCPEPSPAETTTQKEAFAHLRRCIENCPKNTGRSFGSGFLRKVRWRKSRERSGARRAL